MLELIVKYFTHRLFNPQFQSSNQVAIHIPLRYTSFPPNSLTITHQLLQILRLHSLLRGSTGPTNDLHRRDIRDPRLRILNVIRPHDFQQHHFILGHLHQICMFVQNVLPHVIRVLEVFKTQSALPHIHPSLRFVPRLLLRYHDVFLIEFFHRRTADLALPRFQRRFLAQNPIHRRFSQFREEFRRVFVDLPRPRFVFRRRIGRRTAGAVRPVMLRGNVEARKREARRRTRSDWFRPNNRCQTRVAAETPARPPRSTAESTDVPS